MPESRRDLLKSLACATGICAMVPILSGLGPQQAPPMMQPRPSPNAPNELAPAGMNGPQIIHPELLRSVPIDPKIQKEIKAEVEQLYTLASALKDEIEHTDLTMTLPMDFVKSAQDIEKLAKQIRKHAEP